MDEMPPEKRVVDQELAVRQFLDLYNFLSSTSLIYLIPSVEGLQDQTYVANLGIVLPHLPQKPVVISNFKSEPRRGETRVGVDFFSQMGLPVTVAPPYFEGEADCKFLRDNTYFMPYGIRTSMEAIHWFGEKFEMNIIPLELTNPYRYHLDCVIFPITAHKVMVVTQALKPEEIRAIEKVAEIVDIPETAPNWHRGETNCIRCRRMMITSSNITKLKRTDPDYELESKRVDAITKIAADNSLEPLFFDLSAFEVSGADLSCMIMHLNYSDYTPGRSEDA